MRRRPAILLALGALAALTAGPAFAQSGAPLQTPMVGPGPMSSPDDIRYCLCAGQSVTALNGQVAAETQHHQDEQNRLTALDQQLAASKNSVDVSRPDQVDAYRRLVEERERVMADFYYKLTPHLQELVARYNEKSSSYNTMCASHPMDQAMVEQIKATLSCPAEQ